MPIKKNNNPFAGKAKTGTGKKKGSGKRVGKSKPGKANNQLNRRVKCPVCLFYLRVMAFIVYPSVLPVLSVLSSY